MIITKFVLLSLPIGGGGLETPFHPGFCYMRYMNAEIVSFSIWFFPCDFLKTFVLDRD